MQALGKQHAILFFPVYSMANLMCLRRVPFPTASRLVPSWVPVRELSHHTQQRRSQYHSAASQKIPSSSSRRTSSRATPEERCTVHLAKCPLAGMSVLSRVVPPESWPAGAAHWMVLVLNPTGVLQAPGMNRSNHAKIKCMSHIWFYYGQRLTLHTSGVD